MFDEPHAHAHDHPPAPAHDVEAALSAIGPELRQLRLQRDQTLAQLSEATGISVSTLSRLESGQRKPTLELLLPLVNAHQVSLDDLVRKTATADPRVTAPAFERHGASFQPLTRNLGGGLKAYKQVVPPRWRDGETTQKVHEGYEWLYVLSGRLRLLLAEHDLVVGPGEAVEFDTRVPHAFANPTDDPVELLILVGRQGQRVHVTARTSAPSADRV